MFVECGTAASDINYGHCCFIPNYFKERFVQRCEQRMLEHAHTHTHMYARTHARTHEHTHTHARTHIQTNNCCAIIKNQDEPSTLLRPNLGHSTP